MQEFNGSLFFSSVPIVWVYMKIALYSNAVKSVEYTILDLNIIKKLSKYHLSFNNIKKL